MNAYIPSEDELQRIVSNAVQQTVNEALPKAIREATRKQWLTTDEAMDMLQCSRRHIQHLRDSEQLNYYQNNRIIRYKVKDIEDYLNCGKVENQ